MLNLNSLKVIDVDVFLLVSYYFVFFNYSMISFSCPRFNSESGYKSTAHFLICQIFQQLFFKKKLQLFFQLSLI